VPRCIKTLLNRRARPVLQPHTAFRGYGDAPSDEVIDTGNRTLTHCGANSVGAYSTGRVFPSLNGMQSDIVGGHFAAIHPTP
jgi:hypothetical protein